MQAQPISLKIEDHDGPADGFSAQQQLDYGQSGLSENNRNSQIKDDFHEKLALAFEP